MTSRHRCLILLIAICFLGAGCSRQIVEADNPVAIDSEQYKDYFETTIDVLREKGYVIDRRDYRFGTITTLGQGSPNIFEVWNDQNTTADQTISSTLSNEQRRVNVQFAKDEAANKDSGYTFEVEVIRERMEVPTRRMAGSARRTLFTDLAATPRALNEQGVVGTYWEPIGRDELMEARLMKMIRERVAEAE